MRKIFTVFVILATLTMLVSAISIFSLRWTIEAKDATIERHSEVNVKVERLTTLSERRARKLRTYLLTGDPEALQERTQAFAEFRAALNDLHREIEHPEEADLLDAVREANARVLPIIDELVAMKEAGAADEVLDLAFASRLQPRRADLDEAIVALAQQTGRRSVDETRRANRRVSNAALLLGSTVALAMVSAVLLGFTLYRATRELSAEQETLARAARYQQEVMGIVGHDVRSPLAAIIATASLAAQLSKSPGDEQRMVRILRSARRIDALAAVLLDFTRLEVSQRVPVVVEEADFHELVAAQVAQARQADGKLAIEHQRVGDGRAAFDWDRLGQAVEVIFEQVLTYAVPGSTVRVQSRGDVATVALEIAAQCPPIGGLLLRRMFEPFAPGDGEEPVQLSRGFTLYLARELVTAHTGTLDVRPENESGLVFRVHLPREPRPEAPGAWPARRVGGG